MKELLEEDKNFNEAMFKTKVDHTFIMLLTAIMTDNLDRVSHTISKDLKEKCQAKLDDLNRRNRRQMYDELNVKSSEIIETNILEDKFQIKVKLISRYMDYFVDKETGEYISGENTRRIEKVNWLTFEKKRTTKDEGLVRKCPGCGASISINTTGKCAYCGTIYNKEDYDYILVNIETY